MASDGLGGRAGAVSATGDLLRRIAAHDEPCLQGMLSPQARLGQPPVQSPVLDRRTRVLVELVALLTADASTTSLRWAVDRAAATGASDEAVVRVLQNAAGAAGVAQTVKSAARLALALGLDPEPERRSSRAARRQPLGPPPPSVTPLRACDRSRAPAS